MKNIDGQPIFHWCNGENLKVAAYSGLVKSRAFRNFPEVDYLPQYAMYTLSGKEGIAGVQNITWRDVWDFQAGDELHYEVFNTPALLYFITKIQTAESYLARVDYPDSTVYTIAIQTWSYSGPPEDINMQLVDSTIIQRTITDKPGFDGLALTPMVDSLAQFGIEGEAYYLMEYEGAPSKTQAFLLDIPNSLPNCFQPSYTDCIGYSYTYSKGLGGPYHYCSFSNWYIRSRQIVYSLKGGVATGEPLSIANPEAHSTKGILLYPNPAVQNFRILLPEESFPARATLMDMQGRTIRQVLLPNREAAVDVESLKPGIYMVNITGHNAFVHIARIVVR
jgi:hypothetical protein